MSKRALTNTTTVFRCASRRFSEVFLSCTIFRHSGTLVFQCARLTAVTSASHLICHLLHYDNWSNWTFRPRPVTGNLVAVSARERHGAHVSGTLGGKWRAEISFKEKPRRFSRCPHLSARAGLTRALRVLVQHGLRIKEGTIKYSDICSELNAILWNLYQ